MSFLFGYPIKRDETEIRAKKHPYSLLLAKVKIKVKKLVGKQMVHDRFSELLDIVLV